MEKKGDGFEILKTEEIGILKEKLCKLKHSGKHLTESLEAQTNMQKVVTRQQNPLTKQNHKYPTPKKPQNQPEAGGMWNTFKSGASTLKGIFWSKN